MHCVGGGVAHALCWWWCDPCIVLVVALARQEMGQGKKRPQMSPYTDHFCKEPFSADVTPRQT